MKLKEALEDKAKEYAEKAHEGQTRKFGGKPYVSHPNNVASIVKRFKSSHKIDALVSAALLHDTIEDTDTTEEDLHKLFGGLVASLVKELTSDPKGIEEKGKAEYLSDKLKSVSSWALVIKLADRLDNVSDLKTATPEFAEKYGGETRYLLRMLKKERKFTNTQQKLVDAIEEKLDELEDHSYNEEWVDTVKSPFRNQKSIEIFANPSKKEIRSIGSKYVRFVIDEKAKKIYVWNSSFLHGDFAKKMTMPYYSAVDNFVYGTADVLKNGELDLDSFSNGDEKLIEKIETGKHWSAKWFNFKVDEAFVTSVKNPYRKESVIEIFVNPSKKEILSIENKYIRFIVDEKKKKIYIFDGDLLHYPVSKKLGIPYLSSKMPDFTFGTGEVLRNGIIELYEVYSENKKLIKQIDTGKHWSSKYFDFKVDEAFTTRIKVRNSIRDQIDIFENPSRQELNSIKRQSGSSMVRFIIDNRLNKIYVWDAEVWHKTVAGKLKIPFEASGYNSTQFGYGQGLFDGKRIDVAYIRSDPKLLKKIKKRGHWSNRWLSGTDEI